MEYEVSYGILVEAENYYQAEELAKKKLKKILGKECFEKLRKLAEIYSVKTSVP